MCAYTVDGVQHFMWQEDTRRHFDGLLAIVDLGRRVDRLIKSKDVICIRGHKTTLNSELKAETHEGST